MTTSKQASGQGERIFHHLYKVDAEIGGLITIVTLPKLMSAEKPEIGTATWAAQQSILEKFPSTSKFQEFFEPLSPEQQMGWVSLLKGRAAEYMVAYETGSTVHEDWTIPDHDMITPEGDFIQVKTGSAEYIESTLDEIKPEIEVHSGIEGLGIENVTAHDWSDDSLESAIHNLDSIDLDTLDFLGSSLVIGSVLSGTELINSLRQGQIELNDAPRLFTVKTARRTARCAVVGISLTSSSPIIVTVGTAYLVYKSRHLVTLLYRNSKYAFQWAKVDKLAKRTFSALWLGLKHPLTRKGSRFVGRSVVHLTKGVFRSLKWLKTKSSQ